MPVTISCSIVPGPGCPVRHGGLPGCAGAEDCGDLAWAYLLVAEVDDGLVHGAQPGNLAAVPACHDLGLSGGCAGQSVGVAHRQQPQVRVRLRSRCARTRRACLPGRGAPPRSAR